MRAFCVCLLLVHIKLTHGYDVQTLWSSGSSVVLSLGYSLNRNQSGGGCDEFTWTRGGNVSGASTEWTILIKNTRCRETHNNLTARMKITQNGSLEILNVTREDSGRYKVETHSSGKSVYTRTYIVTVQVPVSEPVLDVRCLQNGSAVISCRVQSGSDPVYSLSVSGVTLVDSRSSRNVSEVTLVDSRSSGNVSEVITELSYDPWKITCSARNNISHRETVRTEKKCPVPVSVPVLNVSCGPDGSAEISCEVQNGSEPVFSWSRDGKDVNGNSSELKSWISLPVPALGFINCTVNNSVSSTNNTIHVACPVPVSEPVLDVRCLSNGSAVISCWVQSGSDPVYSLSVSGVTLVDSRSSRNVSEVTLVDSRSSGNVSEVITEPSYDPWKITCSARNSISHRETVRTEKKCPVPLSVPAVSVSCEPDGRARVLCTVQSGTDPVYTWAVNGEAVRDNSNTLYQGPMSSAWWNVNCTVTNDVSSESHSWSGQSCPVPVSEPVLDVRCLRNGSAVISCRVQNGSDPVYSLSVKGVTLVDSSSSGNVSEVITEPSYDPWNITCSARNIISHRETVRTNTVCSVNGSSSVECLSCLQKSIIGGSVVLLVTSVPLFVVCLYPVYSNKKKV